LDAAAAPPVFLLTRVEAGEDKASEKPIALPDRPAKAVLADKARDRRPLVTTCGGTASKTVIPAKVEPRGAHLPRQKISTNVEEHVKREIRSCQMEVRRLNSRHRVSAERIGVVTNGGCLTTFPLISNELAARCAWLNYV
jgi:hypothetical protein